MKTAIKSIASLLLACTVVLSLASGAVVCKAAGYSGSGTMADPYIVTNAQQLQDMREDLSAHYKLGNTIDLAGVDFKPIGRLDAGFSGSFLCELNGDNTPKYVIKNLTVTVEATPYGAENKNKWEAALFGATDGATLMGIYVLDAKITNNNFGDNRGSVVYNNYKPGMDEMNSAILVGEAKNTTIVSCGTTGIVDTSANHCGGMVGIARGCTVENCYSTASVTSKGYWNVGGLIGCAESTTVTGCFSTGNVKNAQSNAGGFIGAITGTCTVSDCYATGSATTSKEDCASFAPMNQSDNSTLTNCFATGAVSAVKQNTWGGYTAVNCYVLSESGGTMPRFQSADMATIKSKLTGANWDMTGEMPVLKNIGVVKDASGYQPQTVSETGDIPENTQEEAGTESGAPQLSPAEVAAMIEKLPDPEEENAVTMDCKDAAIEAYNAYETLSMGDKDAFDAKLTAKVLAVRTKLSIPLAGSVVQGIKNLPEVNKLTSKHAEDILVLWKEFSFLDETVQAEIDVATVEKLQAAHAFVQQEQSDAGTESADTALTTGELLLVIGCSVVFLAAITVDVAVGVVLLGRMKSTDKKGRC